MQSTLPHLQNQPNKKAKHDLSKKKITLWEVSDFL